MTEIKQTQIETLKAKIYGVLMMETKMHSTNINEAATILIDEWIDENNILIID